MSTDAELAAASASGDREAFRRIVERYQSLLCAVAYSSTGDLALSEDLAQETFVAAWRGLDGLREGARLRAWLCGILHNLVKGARRRRRRDVTEGALALADAAEPRSPEPTPVQNVLREEEQQVLWRALERVPESYRVPLVLYYREERSVGTVAGLLGLSRDATKQRLSRGRRMLKTEVAAFVEGALERTRPGAAFAIAVVGSLPGAAGGGAAVGASGAAAKTGGSGMLKAGVAGLVVTAAAIAGGVLTLQPEPDLRDAPAAAALVPVQTQFGPAAEYVLPGDSFLDLESGTVRDLPRVEEVAEVAQWIKQNGMDLGYEGRGGGVILGWNMVAVPWPNEAWDAATPAAVADEPYVALGKPAFPAVLQTGGHLPATFAFATGEGSMGILQVRELDTEGRGAATIRCKMTGPPGQARPPATGPAQMTSDGSLPPAAFGPAVEAMLGDRRGQGLALIDFETQRTLPTPADAGDLGALIDWMAQNGPDAFCDTQGAVRGLVGLDMSVVPLHPPQREWDTGRPDEYGPLMEALSVAPGFPMCMPATGEPPATYLIRTREGTIGLLQVLGLAADPTPGVRFRYKMAGEDPTRDIHTAARKGDNWRVRTLLNEGVDPNARDDRGRTPLHLAAFAGRIEAAKLLLRAGADVGAAEDRGGTPLHATAWSIPPHQPKGSRQVEVMKLLLAAGADPNAVNAKTGFTPLHEALRGGDHCIEGVQVLLANGASVDARDNHGRTPLFEAMRHRTPEATRLLIEHGADVRARDEDGSTPLHEAAHGRHVEVARLLLDHAADIEARNSGGYTPLHWAIGPDSREIVALLIERGAEVNAVDNRGNTPTGRAVKAGLAEIAELLAEHGGVE